MQKYRFEEFTSGPEHYGSAERFLQLAIEVLTDMGNHVIADEGMGEVNWHSDIPTILAEQGHIDRETSERWIRMIGFRNILVHGYMDIDHRIVYDVLQHRLTDIEHLGQVFARFL